MKQPAHSVTVLIKAFGRALEPATRLMRLDSFEIRLMIRVVSGIKIFD